MSYKKMFVLSVGIGSYSQLPNLTCPPNDARDFAAVLREWDYWPLK